VWKTKGTTMESRKVEVLILGSGCAGHTAAIYAARAHLQPVIIEGGEPGGQLALTSVVENYPGFPNGVGGFELVDNMKKQAMHFGASYVMESTREANLRVYPFQITTQPEGDDETHVWEAGSLIIATGARARLLGVPGEKRYFAHGVHTCATCDGAFYKGKKIIVVGGGDTAMEDSLFLTRFAQEVHIFHRRNEFRASKIMQRRVLEHPKIKVHWNTEIQEIYGDGKRFQGAKTIFHPQGNPSDKIRQAGDSTDRAGVTQADFACDGLFYALGHVPNTEFLRGQLPTNKDGYILPLRSPEDCATCDVYTGIPGVFVAGDIVDYEFQQAITAAAMGCKAAIAAEEFLSAQQERKQ
jgi:thioredoxin reductase (NADPH)